MSAFSGPKINKIRGGLGRTSDTGVVFGLIAGGVAADDLSTDEGSNIAKITRLSDAETLGINASYDANNSVLVYQTLKRIFLYAPEAIVYLKLVLQNAALTNLDEKIPAFVLDEATNREITFVAVLLNPNDGYEPSFTTGLDSAVYNAIDDAQAAVNALQLQGYFLDGVVLEGRLEANLSLNLTALPNLRTKACDSVSVVIGSDPALVSIDPLYANSADVGSVLGMLAIRKVSECLGSADIAEKPSNKKGTETYPLTIGTQYYATAQLSNGKKYTALSETEKEAMDAKGYIYIGKYEGMAGYFFSDSHTTNLATDDYAYIEDNRVWNKAARLLRQALLPIMKGTVEVDPATGFLSASFVKYMESKGLKKLAVMSRNGEISGEPTITIPVNQNIVSTGKVSLSLTYVRQGILRELEGDVYAINPAA